MTLRNRPRTSEERLLLEEKLSGLSRLMRCIRVGGVILYSFDNGHFMAYTSPPPAAEPLLKEKPLGGCIFQLLRSTTPDSRPQPRPRGTPMKSAQGVRSTTEGEIFKGTDGACADPDTQNFPCHRSTPQP